jgi:threonine dehydratase
MEIDAADVVLGSSPLYLKLELFQHSGSFKVRGAFANLLTREVPAAGVVAASGGNHGAAVAFAAMKLKVPAKIFVPRVSSPAKIQRIREYGADLVIEGDRYNDALAASEAWERKSGAMSVHAYDQDETMLGQGTIGLELDEQAADIDTLLVAPVISVSTKNGPICSIRTVSAAIENDLGNLHFLMEYGRLVRVTTPSTSCRNLGIGAPAIIVDPRHPQVDPTTLSGKTDTSG